jgi:hypothetical protein
MSLEEPPQPLVSASTDNSEKAALQDNAKSKAIGPIETSKEVIIIEAGQDGETEKKEEQGGAKDYIVTCPASVESTSSHTLCRHYGAMPNPLIVFCTPLAS